MENRTAKLAQAASAGIAGAASGRITASEAPDGLCQKNGVLEAARVLLQSFAIFIPVSAWGQPAPSPSWTCERWNDLGTHLIAQGKYIAAVAACEAAVRRAEAVDTEGLALPSLLESLASVYRQIGKSAQFGRAFLRSRGYRRVR